jgi:hypothetical protein
VNCLLVHASDGLINIDSISWSFLNDLSRPIFSTVSPSAGSILTERAFPVEILSCRPRKRLDSSRLISRQRVHALIFIALLQSFG